MSVDEETTVDMAVAEVASAEMDANGSSVGETPAANPTASETEGLDAPVAEASALTQRRLLESSASTQRGLLESSAFNKALIVACALAWGFSFFVMKDVTELFPVFWLLLVRFGISSAIMAVVFRKAIFANLNLPVVKTGVLLGVLYGAGYIFQTYGIVFTTPGKNAFLTGVYCVLVPFCAWALGHGRPRRVSLIAAFVSLVGAGFVVLDNGLPLNVGDALTLVGSVFYALEMVVVSSEGRGKDVWALTFWQFVTITLIVAAGFLLVEEAPAPALYTFGNVASLVFLAVVCSFGTLALLNYALTKVDPASGSLLSSLESPSGVAFSVAFGYESLTPKLLVGFVLIFAGIVFSEVGERLIERWPSRR